jgi:hypothetical protein
LFAVGIVRTDAEAFGNVQVDDGQSASELHPKPDRAPAAQFGKY